jgi:hypothetical protein
MLQKTFKSADELGLDEDSYKVLHQVLSLLETGEISEAKFNMYIIGIEIKRSLSVEEKISCGTPRCILGWAEVFSKKHFTWPHPYNPQTSAQIDELYRLFYPYHSKKAWDASTGQAAETLRNYLTTGKENWKQIMGEV